MRKITPYASLSGAVRALDNGGRFYNVFTDAGDDVVSVAELRKVAGVYGGYESAFLYFHMASAELSRVDQGTLVSKMEPDLREKLRRRGPTVVKPSRFERDAEEGKPFVATGFARHVRDESRVTGYIMIPIMAGNVTTFMPMPMSDMFEVRELYDDRTRAGRSCLVTMPKRAKAPLGVRVRWGGVAKKMNTSKSGKGEKRLYLDTAYYTPVG